MWRQGQCSLAVVIEHLPNVPKPRFQPHNYQAERKIRKLLEEDVGTFKCIPVILVSRRLNAGAGKHENILIHFRIRDSFCVHLVLFVLFLLRKNPAV